ncbi:hypothetical protein XCR1_1540014 [Xenorhabdus cabanillasii JM26]|uniref:Uncharacterized protein n=1 Tax=Xenorhabdus cabanillasii JM26 TaxID=1427517 RepID=W1IPW7_9GAMM|nr:hypothetical protein XCR1_1540014 [Xenorhabdus cabanillasii JM26]
MNLKYIEYIRIIMCFTQGYKIWHSKNPLPEKQEVICWWDKLNQLI